MIENASQKAWIQTLYLRFVLVAELSVGLSLREFYFYAEWGKLAVAVAWLAKSSDWLIFRRWQ